MSIRLESVTGVAKEIGICRQTLYNWIKAGLIYHRHNVGGAPVFTRWEIDWARRTVERRRKLMARLRVRV